MHSTAYFSRAILAVFDLFRIKPKPVNGNPTGLTVRKLHSTEADMGEIEIRDGGLGHSFHYPVWAMCFPAGCSLQPGFLLV